MTNSRSGAQPPKIFKRLSAGLAAAAIATSGLASLLLPAAPAAAAPVGCDSSFYNTEHSAAQLLVRRAPDGTVSTVGTAGTTYETLALNPIDGNLYGIAERVDGVPGREIIRIEGDGSTTNLGAPAGLPMPIASSYYASAAFDDSGGLWLGSGGNGNVLFRVDVATMTATTLAVTAVFPTGDFAYHDGAMWGLSNAVANARVMRVDLTTGVVTSSAPVPGLSTSVAVFSTGDGHLYASNINNGPLLEIVGFDTSNPARVVVDSSSRAWLDGASCPTAPTPYLNAEADDFSATPVLETSGGVVGGVYGNDTLNAAAFPDGAVSASVVDGGGVTGITIGADGSVTVPAGAAPGIHVIEYRICQTAADRTAICDTAAVTFAVTAVPVLDAVDDDFSDVVVRSGTGGAAGNVLSNDTVDNGPVNPATVTVSVVDDGGLAGVTLTPDGTLTVPASAAAGAYIVGYRICDVTTSSACDDATVAVLVAVAPPVEEPPGEQPASQPEPNAAPGGEDALATTGSTVQWRAVGAAIAMLMTGAMFLVSRHRSTTSGH